MEELEKIEYKGYIINIYQDDNTESPKSWGNDDLVAWSRDFEVENKYINKNSFRAYIKDENFAEYKDDAKELVKKFFVYPLDAYIHSGIRLSMHGQGYRCRWDTSDYIGAIIVKKEDYKNKKGADKVADGILETWNNYLSGNVYGYQTIKQVKCKCCNNVDDENIGSCWGFYGDYNKNGMVDEAKAEIDGIIKENK